MDLVDVPSKVPEEECEALDSALLAIARVRSYSASKIRVESPVPCKIKVLDATKVLDTAVDRKDMKLPELPPLATLHPIWLQRLESDVARTREKKKSGASKLSDVTNAQLKSQINATNKKLTF